MLVIKLRLSHIELSIKSGRYLKRFKRDDLMNLPLPIILFSQQHLMIQVDQIKVGDVDTLVSTLIREVIFPEVSRSAQ